MLLTESPLLKAGFLNGLSKSIRIVGAIFSLFLLLSFSLKAQTDTWGHEFYISLLPNPGSTPNEAFLHFYTERATSVEVQYSNVRSETYDLPKGGSTVKVPDDLVQKITTVEKLGKSKYKWARVFSIDKIQVAFSNHKDSSLDATTAMPVTTAGHHYMISNLPISTVHIINPGGRVILRMIPELEITNWVDSLDSWPAREERAVLLEEGESYTLRGFNLAGFEIIASKDDSVLNLPGPPPPPGQNVVKGVNCNPLIIYTGSESTNVGLCSQGTPPSHMIEAVAPISTVGSEYMVLPFVGRNMTHHRFLVVALEESTPIEVTTRYSDNFHAIERDTLKRGEYWVGASRWPVVVKSTKPILVSQWGYAGDGCNAIGPPESFLGGPFQINHSSFQQGIEKTKVYVHKQESIDSYYLNVMIHNEDVGKFNISPSVPGIEFKKVVETGYSYASFQVNPNAEYTLEAPGGEFLVTEHGHGPGASYGRNPYREINNLSFEMVVEDDSSGVVKEDICINDHLSFDVDFLKPGLSDEYNKIEWEVNESGEVHEGKTFDMTFTEAGLYRISCTLSTEEDKCITIHTLYREIEVHEIIAERIEGPVSLCPYTEGIVYTLINDGGYIYDWEVEGGTIVGSANGESITVNWGEIQDGTKVTVYVSNEYGCTIEPISLDVTLEPNDQLEPAVAYGDDEVCYTDRDYQIYYTPDIAGADFEWVVDGGHVISGQGSHEVVVEWTEQQGTIYYILTLGDCYGASPELKVKVYDELLPVVSAIDVQCYDKGDGQASINISGGKFPYKVLWSNGATGNSVTNLEPGDYSVLVEDDLGCQKELEFTIDQPAPMRVEAFPRKYCNDQPDGELSIIALGGVGPYSYHLYSSTPDLEFDAVNSTSHFSNLYAGRYTLVVTDANQCTFNLTVDIEDPPLLELKLLSNDPICPGESNGIIAVEAIGGVGPYTYQWETNNTGAILEGISQGDYMVSVSDANGCTATMTVTKKEMYPKMLFPNSFTPNGDGFNDYFSPISPCIPDYDMTLYDRWGKVVFQELGSKGIWDGTQGGEDMPEGVYAYYVTYENVTSSGTFTENIRGYVRLIR